MISMATKMNTVGNSILSGALFGLLLGALEPAQPHAVRVHAQRVGQAGAEALGLDQHRDQRAHLGDAGALGERAQRIGGALARARLEVGELELARRASDA